MPPLACTHALRFVPWPRGQAAQHALLRRCALRLPASTCWAGRRRLRRRHVLDNRCSLLARRSPRGRPSRRRRPSLHCETSASALQRAFSYIRTGSYVRLQSFSFFCSSAGRLHPPRMRGQRDRARVPAAAAEASRAPATARSPKTSRLTARSERTQGTDHAPPLTARSENGIDPALVEQVRTIRDRALQSASESPESEVLLRPRRTAQPLDADRRLRVRDVGLGCAAIPRHWVLMCCVCARFAT